ncbi:MAG: MBL fold metallo-hydrolase [Actinomycetota bacterium]|nr:MBL fold metallo-hydrolase [Actinomycetota bacterium]
MELTKFSHSCVRFDDGERRLVIDPGIFSEVDEALDGVQAVLVTHEHPDHLDLDKVKSLAERDSRLRIWAPAPVAALLAELGEQVVAVGPGEQLDAGGFSVRTYGGQHALIYAAIPTVPNVGYLVEDAVYHPGDSFFVPPVSVETLLVPLAAPWSKISEVIDFVIAVRAPRVHQIHDGTLNDAGVGLVERHVTRFGAEYGLGYSHLDVNESISV